MLTTLLQRCRKTPLIALLALMLLGVQLLQYSPLHNHAREVVDCALCHLQPLGDDSEQDHSLALPQSVAATEILVDGIAIPRAAHRSPYQGRAPPFLNA